MSLGGYTDNEGNIYIGQNLKKFRKLLNLTQIRMGIDLGVTQKQISFWENNIEPMPRYYIKQLIAVYGSRSISVVSEYRREEQKYYEAAIN